MSGVGRGYLLLYGVCVERALAPVEFVAKSRLYWVNLLIQLNNFFAFRILSLLELLLHGFLEDWV
jgi:hypothetical protein